MKNVKNNPMNLITLENKSIKKACSEKFSHRLCVLVTKYRSNQSFQKNVVATAKYVYLARYNHQGVS